jgi:polysaccharide biosynthesis protein VpsQ
MKYISVLFSIFIIAVIVLADNGSLPHFIKVIYDFPNGDKVGHFILYGLLDFFITRAFLSSRPSKPIGWVTLSVGLTLVLLIGLEEFSQKFFTNRTFDLIDLSASYLGLLVGGWVAYKIRKDPKGFKNL